MVNKQCLNELALFAGAGGGILGGTLLGWRTVCAVEQNKYAACVLAARQNDKVLPPFPIWDDVCTFDGKPWRGIVDVISGGFPCQDISIAGKGAGIEGDRSGLWKEFARIISEVRPRFVFVENSPMLTIRGGERVISDLAALGYDAKWICLSAADCGAPHKRDRFWLVANTTELHRNGRDDNPEKRMGGESFPQPGNNGRSVDVAYTDSAHGERDKRTERIKKERTKPFINSGWPPEPDVGRVVNGLAARVDRLSALGNGQVPRVAATAWRELTK